jgi:hypothetical protein
LAENLLSSAGCSSATLALAQKGYLGFVYYNSSRRTQRRELGRGTRI